MFKCLTYSATMSNFEVSIPSKEIYQFAKSKELHNGRHVCRCRCRAKNVRDIARMDI